MSGMSKTHVKKFQLNSWFFVKFSTERSTEQLVFFPTFQLNSWFFSHFSTEQEDGTWPFMSPTRLQPDDKKRSFGRDSISPQSNLPEGVGRDLFPYVCLPSFFPKLFFGFRRHLRTKLFVFFFGLPRGVSCHFITFSSPTVSLTSRKPLEKEGATSRQEERARIPTLVSQEISIFFFFKKKESVVRGWCCC